MLFTCAFLGVLLFHSLLSGQLRGSTVFDSTSVEPAAVVLPRHFVTFNSVKSTIKRRFDCHFRLTAFVGCLGVCCYATFF